MDKKKIISSVIAIAIVMGFVACEKKKEETKPLDNAKVHVFDTRAYDKWVYFSFEQDKEVEVTDFQHSLEWDIAFHRFNVRVNCGTSGIGEGGSISMGQVNFDEVIEAPKEGYALNDSISIVTKPGGWFEQEMVPGDTVMANWLYFTGPPPEYNITHHIYVIKTAKGKYAKVWLKDYYNDNSETGYVTMQYFYQEDGSRELEDGSRKLEVGS